MVGGSPQVTTYAYDAANRLVNAGGVDYTWDNRGNLLDDGAYQYTWNAAGRLITVTDGITTLGFLYDGDGNRLARSVNGALTTHTLDLGLGLPEVLVEHNGDDVTRYLHLPHGVASDDGAAWSYSAADGLGSVRQRVDVDGAVLAVNDCRPFGSPLAGDGGEPYGFTGEWWEDDAGLLFLRARYYNPAAGRFLSQDTWRGKAWQPGTLNRFVYVTNNAVNFVDPSGLQGKPFQLDDGLTIYPGGWYRNGDLTLYSVLVSVFIPPAIGGYNDDIDTNIEACAFYHVPLPVLMSTANGGAALTECCNRPFSDYDWHIVGIRKGRTSFPEYGWAERTLMRIGKAFPSAFEEEYPYGPMGMIVYKNDLGQVHWTWDWPAEGPGTIEGETLAPIFFEPWSAIETPHNDIIFNGEIQRTIRWNVGKLYDNDGTSGATTGNRIASAVSIGPMIRRAQEMSDPNARLYTLVVQQKGNKFRALIRTLAGWINPLGPKVYSSWLGYVDGEIQELEIHRRPDPYSGKITIGPIFQFP